MMSYPKLTRLGSRLALIGVSWRVPFVKKIIEKTIFTQFCGGKTLKSTDKVINTLYKMGITTVLDYGSEGRESDEEFDQTLNQTLESINFASSKNSVPYVSSKITGLAKTALLEKYQQLNGKLEGEDKEAMERVIERVDRFCKEGKEKEVAVMIDAEETTVQGTIDVIVEMMMEKYNREKVVVYHTFQMYRKDKLEYLKLQYEKAKEKGYKLGAKLVRGAYMEKERRWASERGYPSPIHPDKAATDRAYNKGLMFCIEYYKDIALCNGSHNKESIELMVDRIEELGLDKNHPHLNFCQLYGMADYITNNLAAHGYNVSKYLPYGPIEEVIPYLIRRAEENAAVTGEMSREYKMIAEEIKRRGI